MYPLATDDALLLVRKNFDEINVDDSDMADVDDVDSNYFEETLAKTLPEAINAIHVKAPVELLDGLHLSPVEMDSVSVNADVLSFGTKEEFLRLVAFKASDSPYVVTEAIPEASTEGRMQLNPYTRGTYDRPRLVLLQGKTEDYLSSFKYYSLEQYFSDPRSAIQRFEYMPFYRYKSGVNSYQVAEKLTENIIDQLTGMMLAIYNNDKANYFFTKASFGTPEA